MAYGVAVHRRLKIRRRAYPLSRVSRPLAGSVCFLSFVPSFPITSRNIPSERWEVTAARMPYIKMRHLFLMAIASSPSKPAACSSGATDAPVVVNRSHDVSEPRNHSQNVENTLESSNRGLSRNASVPVPPVDNRVEFCIMSELPESTFSHIISFQAQMDRLSLATTCSDSLKQVEAFSKRAVEQIGKNADDMWEARIRDPSSIKTEIPHELLELPHRYLLSKAYQTHLYTLSNVPDHLQNNASSDSERHVVVSVGRDPSSTSTTSIPLLQVWDLSTKKCIGRFTAPVGEHEDVEVLVCGDLIICDGVNMAENMRIYTLDGALIRELGYEQMRQAFVYQTKIYYAMREMDDIWSLDPATGDIRHVFSFPAGGYYTRYIDFVVYRDMLVILRFGVIDNDWDTFNDDLNGIYVVDLNDFSQKQFFPGRYKSFVRASDEDSVLAAIRNDKSIDLLLIKDARVSSSTAFTSLHKIDDIFFFSQSQGFIVCRVGSRINVYRTVNGELLQSINDALAYVCNVSITNGQELFLTFDTRAGGMDPAHLAVLSVGAYCLPWYKTGS